MEGGETVKVSVVIDTKPKVIPCSSTFTAEELCILLCKQYKIPPLTRTLFALRVRGKNYFLKDNTRVLSSTRDYELRIRFKVPRIGLLITLDETTYDYYFQQARNDVFENKIPEVKYPEHKPDLLGLGITDMTRAVLENKKSQSEVIRNYKKHIPKVIVRKHGSHPKKYAHDSLPNLISVGNSVNYVKKVYLQHLYGLAPNYLAEEFDNVLWQNGTDVVPVQIVVTPFHPHEPGIRIYNNVTRKWFHMCTIEELIYLTRNGENSLEVSRRGTPLFFKFKSEEQLSSFISVCDGYYRLMVKWTFNLSKDDETPSLKELQRIKCHGPVGGAFSYRKLEEKRAKKHGCYILRQCQDDYNLYYLDVCTKNSTTETYRIEYHGHCYVFNEQEFTSIERIIDYHQNPDGRIFLNECIPPSEYDKSQLLLCGEPQKKGVRIDQAELQEILKDNKSPRCLPSKDILLYTGSEKIGSEGLTATFKALWRLDETKKLVVAFKTLQREKTNDYLKDYIELASKWACVQSCAIVRLYGITLSSPTAMVLEYLPYGPFDDYLREHGETVPVLALKKVSATLARALWDLSEAGVVHGYIRCSRLLLAARDTTRLTVKLAGPSLHRYTQRDVHWMPVEFFSDMSLAKRSVVGDIWAFATTLWEVFSYGQSPTDTNPVLTARSYEMGDRLLRPARCPSEVWALLRPCWQPDPPRPQGIMRDINHMLHAEYMPVHQYEEPKISLNNMDHAETVSSDRFIPSESDAGSNKSLISVDSSGVPSMNGTMSDQYNNSFGDNRSFKSLGSMAGMAGLGGLRAGLSARSLSAAPDDDCLPGTAPRLMESIISQGKTYLVTLNRKIGSVSTPSLPLTCDPDDPTPRRMQFTRSKRIYVVKFSKKIGNGNYGHVYKGVMECDHQESDRKEVAVKKLTRNAAERNSTLYEDFKNELEIMKSLVHVNIVEILGYSWVGGGDVLIVMEYLEEGSLNYYLKFQGDKLRTAHLLKYCLDIASGMDHVSSKGIVHRDLATRNILVVNKYHVKISDFGLARILPREENEYRLKTLRLLPVNWYAPESAVEPYHFSMKSDVWSYGVTAWEIFTRANVEVPKFDSERPQERASCFPNPKDCPWEIYEHLMKICWKLDPKQRPSFINLVHTCKRFMEEYK